MNNIAVTGASGYIGRHVISVIKDNGFQPVSVVYSTEKTMVDEYIIKMDILSASREEVINHFSGMNSVIHLAWQSGFNHHDECHLNNVTRHLNFIESLMIAGVKNISVAGTMHEVGYFVGEIDNNTPCNPINPYGISKNYLRQACLYLANKYNCNLKWLRMYYILGDDNNSNSIFSKILTAEQEKKGTFPLNSGEMLYDFINIKDLSNQIFAASNQDKVNGIINCCSGKPVSLRTTVEKFIKDNALNIKPLYNVFPAREYDSPAIWGSSKIINKIMNND
ncbi:NAD-dependent epimerase/dehydratase family protein [Pantoea agglomerans]|uniref:NAD-dependent epimerase/dehydratase family protein n=1 Tax=Enterobacter agglomerans TaxID=549 RepID=UPI00277F2C88|nr:NAD-dependent epimerase/dehydratase family protein [Pantoea agglomerans]MDQ0432321.1 dTDP-6-deoxy-L-talose 4-dehydrogenase (NAD+) [Pantoea agglomerans]